jgi:predicted nucleotidyltransferase
VATSPIDLSDRAALPPLARLLAAVRPGARDAPVLLVGAAARDVLLVHFHGVPLLRATEDTDVAVAVRDWDAFLALRQSLIDSRLFRPEGPPHRLYFGSHRLDIIPFGGVERGDRSIEWPIGSLEVMSVWGFSEALASALPVQLPGEEAVLVASLPALALLKLWAWEDRRYLTRKDASDPWLLLRFYADAGNQDRLFGPEGEAALASFRYDLEMAGAWLLGHDARRVLSHGGELDHALRELSRILVPETDADGPLRLVSQMPPGDRDRQLAHLVAFRVGLFGES